MFTILKLFLLGEAKVGNFAFGVVKYLPVNEEFTERAGLSRPRTAFHVLFTRKFSKFFYWGLGLGALKLPGHLLASLPVVKIMLSSFKELSSL